MTTFNCLDPKESLYSHTLIEASAGTGKTFAIEHLVTRFILDGISMERILVVTFTIAATKELKERIATCIERARCIIKSEEITGVAYLDQVCGRDEKKRFTASLFLEKALLDIDKANICTIHSFCSKSLDQKGLMVRPIETSESVDYKGFYCAKIKAALSQIIDKGSIATGSLTRLVRSYQSSFDKLYAALIDHIASDSTSISAFSFKREKEAIAQAFDKHLPEYIRSLEKILPLFKGFYSSSKELKKTFTKQLKACTPPFTDEKLDRLITEKVSLFSLLDMANIKKSAEKHIDNNLRALVNEVSLIKGSLEKLRDTRLTFLHLAKLCSLVIEKDPDKLAHTSPDEIIHMMCKAITDDEFAKSVSSLFDVAIIDEFQDTDASQWAIFSTLFSKRRAKAFFLVGDPKQSIYSFRKADINLFYKAKKQMDHLAHLDTNYRSSSSLQISLNRMFSYSNSWLDTPGFALPYTPVKVPSSASRAKMSDEKQAVHFALYTASSKNKKTWPTTSFEKEVLFPFLANEILLLHRQEKIPFSKMAILVKDRFSKNRLASYFSTCGIPYRIGRGSSLFDTPVFDFFSLAMLGIIDQGLFGTVESILTHPLGKEYDTLFWKKHLVFCHKLWKDKGFSHAIGALFSCLEGQSLSIMDELYAIVDQFYTSFEFHTRRMETMKAFLLSESHHFLNLQKTEKRQDLSSGVEIMTTFMSKGLEFDIVFPISLLYRHSSKTKFIRYQGFLVPFEKENIEHKKVLESSRSEKLRQLYVAMTRAKKRLYLPFIIDEEMERVELNARSSLELFLPSGGLTDHIKRWGASTHFLEKVEVHPCYKAPKIEKVKEKKRRNLESQMVPKFIESFSSLTANHDIIKAPFEAVDDLLPSNKQTGLLLHSIIEQMIEKKLYLDPEGKKAQAFITKSLAEQYQEHEAFIKKMVTSVFTMPILPTPLCEIGPENLDAEFAFTFREKGMSMTGFIDLVVIYENQIFVMDWKSNQLPSYKKDVLIEEMDRHQYELQARIYKTALLQSLRVKPLGLSFGGSYYIFLRGLPSGEGVLLVNKEEKA